MSLSEDAAALARVAHSGQFDKVGVPYFEHVSWVAEAVREAGFPDDVVATGFLHDVVEDTDITLEDLAEFFPPQIVAAVDALSKRKSEPFADYYERVKADPIATAVKWFDVKHNSHPGRLSKCAPDTQERLRPKYERALATLGSPRG